jgi:hypothetical protein
MRHIKGSHALRYIDKIYILANDPKKVTNTKYYKKYKSTIVMYLPSRIIPPINGRSVI